MNKTFASLLATAACFSMVATPALARGHGRGGGWGGGAWGGGWGRHHDDGIDGGDILAGLLIFGTIAVVASAASKSAKDKEDDTYRYPDQSRPAPRYDDRQQGSGARDWGRSRSIDAAVDTCVGEIERGSARVDSVDSVDRDGDGWRVSGKVRSGMPYACSVGSDGRVRNLSVDGKAPY